MGYWGRMIEAQGWAVVRKDKLLVRTVSPTRRGALVNWIVVEAPRGRVMVTNTWDDAQIEEHWARNRGDAHAVPVTIRVAD